jgi:hypothetical protein
VFSSLFGRRPRAVAAPDYHWDDRCEDLWLARDLTMIQAKREQQRAEYAGFWGRVRKLGERTSDRQRHRDRVYLERNVRFEPAQHAPLALVTAQAEAAVVAAWRRGEPAIVEAHRVNFVHLDAAVAAGGRAQLAELLGSSTLSAEARPLYLVDAEVGGLQRYGTSWCDRGDRFVVRNLTRSRRLVVVPDAAGVVVLGPGETEVRRSGTR